VSTIGGPAVNVNATIARPSKNARLMLDGPTGQQATVGLTGKAMDATRVVRLSVDGRALTSAPSTLAGVTLATQTLPATGAYTIGTDPGGASPRAVTVSVTRP